MKLLSPEGRHSDYSGSLVSHSIADASFLDGDHTPLVLDVPMDPAPFQAVAGRIALLAEEDPRAAAREQFELSREANSILIRQHGSGDFSIPEEYGAFTQLVHASDAQERTWNEYHQFYDVRLTGSASLVLAGKSQRQGVWHCDRQLLRRDMFLAHGYRMPVGRQYSVASNTPTEIEGVDSEPFSSDIYEVTVLDEFTDHRSPRFEEPGIRVWGLAIFSPPIHEYEGRIATSNPEFAAALWDGEGIDLAVHSYEKVGAS